MKKEFSFLIADNHIVVHQGLELIIKNNFEKSIIFSATNFSEIIQVIVSNKINLLILEINFSDGIALDYIELIKNKQPEIKILIFSGEDEFLFAIRYLRAGVNGYLSKVSNKEDIYNALVSVFETGKFISKPVQNKIYNSVTQQSLETNPLELLSNREIEIARLMINRFENKKIAILLKLQRTTVSTYKNRIFEKLQIRNTSDLAHIFSLYQL